VLISTNGIGDLYFGIEEMPIFAQRGKREDWLDICSILEDSAMFSACRKRGVAAALVDIDIQGGPILIRTAVSGPRYGEECHWTEGKCPSCIHAEIRLCLAPTDVIVVTRRPCISCSEAIMAIGIRHIWVILS